MVEVGFHEIVVKLLDEIQHNLLQRALQFRDDATVRLSGA